MNIYLLKTFLKLFQFIFLACFITLVYGQAAIRQIDPVVEVLSQNQPIGAACRREDVRPSVGKMGYSQNNTKLDLTCLLPATDVAEFIKKSDAMLIDMRSATEYQAIRASNAINFSLSDILTKPFLRNKPLVLMGAGKGDAEIYRACSRLKKEGYRQVYVAQGGILGWAYQKNDVEGRSKDFMYSVQLSVAELWIEAQSKENYIFLDDGRESMNTFIPSSLIFNKNAVDILRSLVINQKTKKQNKNFLNLIVITNKKLSDQHIKNMQQAVLPVPLLIYSDSENSYIHFMKQQEAIWLAQDRGPKTPACGL
ncbi:MAG: rhodanese-like domain-containing protein [Burkholderiales bacterium]|jgi:rhodanese-related sulfurtransferase|nr:rhodanese-like domain-containing protein [Burkholderiales bacterium]